MRPESVKTSKYGVLGMLVGDRSFCVRQGLF